MALKYLLLVLHAVIVVLSAEEPCRDDGNYSYEGLTSLPSHSPTCNQDHTLIVKGNELARITADQLEGYQALRRLDVSQNQLVYVEAGSFASTSHLTVLIMSENRIASLEQVFIGAVSLTDIDLAHNEIEYLDSGSFRGTRALENVKLSDNRISRINETTFSQCRNLRKLDLAHNEIEILGESVFATNENLVTLNLQDNRLNYISPSLFVELRSLRNLDLSDNPLAPIHLLVTTSRILILANNCGQTGIPSIEFEGADESATEINLRDNKLNCNCDVLWISSNRTVRCFDEETGSHSDLTCVDPDQKPESQTTSSGESNTKSETGGHNHGAYTLAPWYNGGPLRSLLVPLLIPMTVLEVW